jgi:hypothetical protein
MRLISRLAVLIVMCVIAMAFAVALTVWVNPEAASRVSWVYAFTARPDQETDPLQSQSTPSAPAASPSAAASPVATQDAPPTATQPPAPTLVATPQASSSDAAPTAEASAPVSAMAKPLSVDAIRQKLGEIESTLRTGEFEAQINFSNGENALTAFRFDLSEGQEQARYHIKTTNRSGDNQTIVEQLFIGPRIWQRQAESEWVEVSAPGAAISHLPAFLPDMHTLPAFEVAADAELMALRWYDSAGDSDVTLLLDPATSTPRELRRVHRQGGMTITVRYIGWNTPVAITVPGGR